MSIEINLEDFDEDDITKYAEDYLDMVKNEFVSLDVFDSSEIIEHLEFHGYHIKDRYLSIIEEDLLERLEANIKGIDLFALEQFLQDYGV